MNTFELIDIAFTALEQRKHSSSGGQHGRKSAVCGAHELPGEDSPTADLGLQRSVSPIRFWTVRFERGGRSYYDRVEAPDAWIASTVALTRNKGATCSQVVREIDRAEFDRLTGKR